MLRLIIRGHCSNVGFATALLTCDLTRLFSAFTFESLAPAIGREGDICTCVFRFGKVEKDVNIGFGLLFGAAVPAFDEDNMETGDDSVRIRFRVPARVCDTPL